jgi:hypothetical protein
MTSEFANFLQNIEQFEPLVKILLASLTVLMGWLVSGGIGQLVTALLDKIKLNKALKRMGWEEALAKAEIKLNVSGFLGEIVKWIFVTIFLMVGSELLGLTGLTDFLIKVLVEYVPNIVIAGLIFVVAVFLTDFSYRIVIASAEKAKISYSRLLGIGIRAAIWTFAVLAILLQLGVATEIIKAMVYGLVGIITLAVGLAFGLGGEDLAAEFLRELKEKVK